MLNIVWPDLCSFRNWKMQLTSHWVLRLNPTLSLLAWRCTMSCWLACTVLSLGRFTLTWHWAKTTSCPITTVLDQLKRLMRPCIYHVTQRAGSGGAGTQTGGMADNQERDDRYTAGMRSHDGMCTKTLTDDVRWFDNDADLALCDSFIIC